MFIIKLRKFIWWVNRSVKFKFLENFEAKIEMKTKRDFDQSDITTQFQREGKVHVYFDKKREYYPKHNQTLKTNTSNQ